MGCAVPLYAAQEAQKKLNEKGHIEIERRVQAKPGERWMRTLPEEHRFLRPEDIEGFELAVVSYKGSGKYKDYGENSNRLLRWEDLFSDTILLEEQIPLTQEKYLPPPGQGWWPVVTATLTDSAAEKLEIMNEVVDGITHKVKIVVCFYQLCADGSLIGWWIWVSI